MFEGRHGATGFAAAEWCREFVDVDLGGAGVGGCHAGDSREMTGKDGEQPTKTNRKQQKTTKKQQEPTKPAKTNKDSKDTKQNRKHT